MRVPVEWLMDYCGSGLSTAELEERLTMTGTKVEAIHHHGPGPREHFVIGRVLEARPHPDADRLTVCMVDIGHGSPSQIVCGAPNVAEGQTVAVATPGAVMPNGITLANIKLRGVESNGMILAEDELAIGSDHEGILVLESDGLEPGTPLDQQIPFATDVLELEVTPNRPDCLGIYGVAREVHGATGEPLSPPPWAEDPGTSGPVEGAAVDVQCPDLCPRFTARVFEDVRIGPSPPWLKARLTAAGQRPISNVVDITNYVMLETGQPLHAFDLDRVAGRRLTVRRARPGEQLETLDGQTRMLDDDMVVIEDADGPTSIAGVMGGARSEVHDGTTRVLMEAASWHGANIHRTSLKLGLRSEASTRFEKQLQPEQAMEALAVVTRLMIELCRARVAEGTIDVGGPGPEPVTIRLRERRVAELLGAPIPRERCREILEAIEFETSQAPDGLDVKPPAFRRADITREADVIEEVARLDGLDKLPATLPSRHGASGRLTPRQRMRRRASDALAAQGLNEIVGWSFTGPELYARLRIDPAPAVVELANPLSGEQAQLRTTLLGSLLDAAVRNRAHGASTVRLFEAGAVYLPSDAGQLPREPYHLAALLAGPVREPSWREAEPPQADFFAVKAVVAGLFNDLGISWEATPSAQPFLHPGRAAAIIVGGRDVGWLGELHPAVADETAAFELDLDAIGEPGVAIYEDVTSFPAVREDLAVVVDDRTAAAEVVAIVREAGGPLLADAQVFDVYRDPRRIGDGKVSLALRLTYRAPDRTLTDEEVAARRQEITAALASRLGGVIRAA
jgi:phenylalanyl-tRNA synthetase beta chain